MTFGGRAARLLEHFLGGGAIFGLRLRLDPDQGPAAGRLWLGLAIAASWAIMHPASAAFLWLSPLWIYCLPVCEEPVQDSRGYSAGLALAILAAAASASHPGLALLLLLAFAARLLGRQRVFASREAYLAAAFRESPEKPRVLVNWAEHLHGQRQLDRAYQLYSEATVSHDRAGGTAAANMIDVLLLWRNDAVKRQRLHDGDEYLREALRVGAAAALRWPDHLFLHFNHGAALILAGQFPAAEVALTRAIANFKASHEATAASRVAKAHQYRAFARGNIGDVEGANRDLAAARQQSGNSGRFEK